MVTKRFLGLFLSCLLLTEAESQTQTQTVDICTEIRETILHPAQYVSEQVRRGCGNLLTPHCCGPSWPSHPECYVTRQRTISEAWEEITKKLQCNPKTVEVGFQEFMRRRIDPRLKIPQVRKIGDHINLLLDACSASAKPLPEEVRQDLHERLPTLVTQLRPGVRAFAAMDIENARYVSSELACAYPLTPITYETGQDSIVWGKLIIAGPDLRSSWGCTALAMWGHELVHVRQYRDAGFTGFLTSYLEDTAPYEEKGTEREATEVATYMMRLCQGLPLEPLISQPAPPPPPPSPPPSAGSELRGVEVPSGGGDRR